MATFPSPRSNGSARPPSPGVPPRAATPSTRAAPAPTLAEERARIADTDAGKFEYKAAELVRPTTTRPALTTPAEVESLRRTYTTGQGRLDALASLAGTREAYWDEQRGLPPFDALTEFQRAEAKSFFEAHGVALAEAPPDSPPPVRQAPPNPIREREAAAPSTPAAVPPRVTPSTQAGNTPSTRGQALPALEAQDVPGVVRGLPPSPPATVEIEYISARGFACRLTVVAVTGSAALDAARGAEKKLVELGARPRPEPRPVALPSSSAPAAAAAPPEAIPQCAIHHTPMAKRTGRNGQSFWSCPQHLDDGSWCPYRPPK